MTEKKPRMTLRCESLQVPESQVATAKSIKATRMMPGTAIHDEELYYVAHFCVQEADCEAVNRPVPGKPPS